MKPLTTYSEICYVMQKLQSNYLKFQFLHHKFSRVISSRKGTDLPSPTSPTQESASYSGGNVMITW